MKLELIIIYNAYSKKSPFKYYISISGGGVQNLWKHAYIKIKLTITNKRDRKKNFDWQTKNLGEIGCEFFLAHFAVLSFLICTKSQVVPAKAIFGKITTWSVWPGNRQEIWF